MRNKTAFTLIELLVVVAIIVTLLAILLPSMGRAVAISQRVVCQSNLRQIGTGAMSYLGDHYGQFWPKRQLGLSTVFWWVGNAGTLSAYGGMTADERYLNPYIYTGRKFPVNDTTSRIDIAHCPSDIGIGDGVPFFQLYGSTYGSTQHPNYSDLTVLGDNAGAIKLSQVRSASALVMGGENSGMNRAWGSTSYATPSWHEDEGGYTFVHVDGHVTYAQVEFGEVIGDGWTMHEDGRE